MSNPFAAENAWEAGGGWLGAGDHIVKVMEADGTGSSSGGYPQVELKLGNDMGEIRDWIVITPNTVGKVAQVVLALGCEPPSEDEYDGDGDLRIKQSYLDRCWVGAKTGILVRSEPDYKDPTQTRDRVKGYVPASKIAPSDVPNDVPPMTTGVPAAAQSDDSLPF